MQSFAHKTHIVFWPSAPEEKAEPAQAMNALMRLNQLKPGLQYKLLSQTGPVHVPVFTMAVEVDGKNFEASGPSKRTAKLHVAVKVRDRDAEDQLLGLLDQSEIVEIEFCNSFSRSCRIWVCQRDWSKR